VKINVTIFRERSKRQINNHLTFISNYVPVPPAGWGHKMIPLMDFVSILLVALIRAAVIVATSGFPRKFGIRNEIEVEKDVFLLFWDDEILDATQDALAPGFPDLKTALDETPGWTGRLTSSLNS
jgi:hypothetical protein